LTNDNPNTNPTIQDTGPLDWRIGIVDPPTGRPTPEFQRRWATQRNNNALIQPITLGSGIPTSLNPVNGAEYINTATTPYSVYIANNNAWHQAGVIVFTDLEDVPHSYTGNGLALVRVNTGATALEFTTQSAELDTLGTPVTGDLLQRGASVWGLVTVSSVLDGISSTQGAVLYRNVTDWVGLSPGTAGQVLTSGGTGANVSWSTPAGGGLSGTWQNLTSTRSLGTTFTNTNGKIMFISVSINVNVSDVELIVNGVTMALYQGSTNDVQTAFTILNPGDTYSLINAAGSPAIVFWFEWF